MTLTEFLLARIAEDEPAGRTTRTMIKRYGAEPNPDPVMITNAGNAVAVSPDRWLAECEAKRRIVEAVQELWDQDLVDGGAWEDILRPLALPYADHPDYDEAWRP